MLNFLGYLVYFYLRVTDARDYLPAHVDIQTTDDPNLISKVAAYCIFVALLIGLAFMKILSCLKVYESYGHLVQLVMTSLKDLQTFTWFLLGFIFLFSLFYQILGVDVDTGDYSDLSHQTVYLF
jgi:hypothetical protein